MTNAATTTTGRFDTNEPGLSVEGVDGFSDPEGFYRPCRSLYTPLALDSAVRSDARYEGRMRDLDPHGNLRPQPRRRLIRRGRSVRLVTIGALSVLGLVACSSASANTGLPTSGKVSVRWTMRNNLRGVPSVVGLFSGTGLGGAVTGHSEGANEDGLNPCIRCTVTVEASVDGSTVNLSGTSDDGILDLSGDVGGQRATGLIRHIQALKNHWLLTGSVGSKRITGDGTMTYNQSMTAGTFVGTYTLN